MCHDLDSRPPAPPRSGEVLERGTLTLTSADGTEFSAAYAAPAAEAGLPAVAIDWFGRTAGLAGAGSGTGSGTGTRGADFDGKAHVPRTTEAGIDADLATALGYLRGRTRPDLPVLTVGFCFGGSHSWRQSAGDLDLAGCVGFHGRPVADQLALAETSPIGSPADSSRLVPAGHEV